MSVSVCVCTTLRSSSDKYSELKDLFTCPCSAGAKIILLCVNPEKPIDSILALDTLESDCNQFELFVKGKGYQTITSNHS